MKKILIFGSGFSSSYILSYLLKESLSYNWHISVVDKNPVLAKKIFNNKNNTDILCFDVNCNEKRTKIISESDVVVSLLPIHLHNLIAKDCLLHNKSLFTASYLNDEMLSFRKEVEDKDLLFLNECGLDPGIDHMSAMKLIDQILDFGGKITSFKSYCGALIAPDYHNNPWNYKFTWSPRNVIFAGSNGGNYMLNGKIVKVNYQDLFLHTEKIKVFDKYYESYANRDALSYLDLYGVNDINTIYRGTLREVGFCKAWSLIVDFFIKNKNLKGSGSFLLNTFKSYIDDSDLSEKLSFYFDDILKSEVNLSKDYSCPEDFIYDVLSDKWVFEKQDKDLVVMHHEVGYNIGSLSKTAKSSLVCLGEASPYTAISKTVGLPLAIAVKLFLLGKINSKGVLIPTLKEIYNPILKELSFEGVVFKEKL